MGFEYFVPAGLREVVDPDGLRAIGLASVIGGGVERLQSTVEGQAGTLVRVSGPETPFCALSRPMTWRWFCGYRVGHLEGHPPGPDDLARPKMVDGYRDQLSDGNKWVLPTARALPSYIGVDDNGSMVERVRDDWLHLSQMGAEVFEAWRFSQGEGGGGHLSIEREYAICRECLAENYYVGSAELDMLQLLTSEDRLAILLALIDAPGGFGGDDGPGVDKKKDSGVFGRRG